MIGFNVMTLIGIYMVICASLILYHIAYTILDASFHLRQQYATESSIKQIKAQLQILEMGGRIDGLHYQLMERNLKKFHRLQVFHDACSSCKEHPYFVIYLEYMIPIFQQLSWVYQKEHDMEKAYFAWMIADLYEGIAAATTRLPKFLLPYLEHTTIYCRENTLSALYRLGDIHGIENAFAKIEEEKAFHHSKLISDGLLKFHGDRLALCERLWAHYGEWDDYLMAAIIDYMRFVTDAYREVFVPVLQHPATNLEVRLAILRYFRKYSHMDAYPIILACAKGDYELESQIVACSTLSNFASLDAIAVLKSALQSPNWYVRKNAAISLYGMAQTDDLMEIFAGVDQYAKDMMQYVLQEEEGS